MVKVKKNPVHHVSGLRHLINKSIRMFSLFLYRMRAYCFCLVCLSVVNFNLCYNFWIVRNGEFVFGMDNLSIDIRIDAIAVKIAFGILLPAGA